MTPMLLYIRNNFKKMYGYSSCEIAYNDGLKSFRQIVSKSWWSEQNFDVSSLIIEDIPMDEFKNRYSVFMIKNN
jgi:hypothetical protein